MREAEQPWGVDDGWEVGPAVQSVLIVSHASLSKVDQVRPQPLPASGLPNGPLLPMQLSSAGSPRSLLLIPGTSLVSRERWVHSTSRLPTVR